MAEEQMQEIPCAHGARFTSTLGVSETNTDTSFNIFNKKKTQKTKQVETRQLIKEGSPI